MRFEDLVTLVRQRAKMYPKTNSIEICGLGLGGETGEVLELLKKERRDGQKIETELAKELGDVMYYWLRVADHYHLEPEVIFDKLLKKIKSRERKKLRRETRT